MTEIVKVDKVEAHRRAELIRVGMVSYAQTLETIAEAFAARDWVTLGYGSWDEYVDKEFAEKRLKLDADRRREAAEALRLTGMSTRAIGSALGVDQATVVRDLNRGDANASPEAVTGADGKTYATSRPATPRDIEPDKNGPGIESGQVDDLDFEDIGKDYIKDPAERIAAFAAIAPEYVVTTGQPEDRPAEAANPAPAAADGAGPHPVPSAPSPLSGDAEVRAAEFMKRFTAALSKVNDLYQFDAEQVADLAPSYVIESIERHADRMRQLADQVNGRRSGLRLVQGGRGA